MTGETFTEAQFTAAAQVMAERQEHQIAAMLKYAATLRHVYALEELCALGYHDIVNSVCTHCQKSFSDDELDRWLAETS